MKKNIFDKLKGELPGLRENVLLKNYTTYNIGGPAKYFFIAKTSDDLITAMITAKKLKWPIFILGGGSNVLISDKGFNGLVIKIDISDIKLQGNRIIVGAGASLTKLRHLSANKGFSGLEWSAGVPGTIGGAIYGNAQAFGTKISDTVKSVEVIDIKTLKVKSFIKRQCQFSLKDSIFKKNKKLIIISATLEFKKSSTEQIPTALPSRIHDADAVVIGINNKIKEFLKYRKTHHPINFHSPGSTFVNPEKKITNKKLLVKFPELAIYNKIGIIPAGYLISNSSLSGKKIGNAQISEKHANFIVNLGGAKAKDVLALIKLAKTKTKKIFGIKLELEVQLIGF